VAADTPLKVGIVGFGEIAQYHLRHLTACGASVVGAVTRRQLPPGLAAFESLERMLPHVDAITVATPNYLHAASCLQAIDAGIAALIEKPLCITSTELAALERALPRARRPVHVGYRLRWNPALRALRDRVRPRVSVACTYRLGLERLARGKPWTCVAAQSGGPWFTLGVHALDVARWLAQASGEPMAPLRATASERGDTADFPLLASLSGAMPGGLRVDASVDLRGDAAFRLEVIVDGRRIDLSGDGFPGPSPEQDGAADAEYSGLVAEFVKAARSGSADTAAAQEVLEMHRELLAAAERTAGAL
jgi:predicted dehydrogenase